MPGFFVAHFRRLSGREIRFSSQVEKKGAWLPLVRPSTKAVAVVAQRASPRDVFGSNPKALARSRCHSPSVQTPAICVLESPPVQPGTLGRGWIALQNPDWSLALVRRMSFGKSARTEM